jgi:hypothetical protein
MERMRLDHPKKGPTSLFPPSSNPHHLVHAFENVFEEQKSHWLSCK